jgi:hypothetical protein
MAHQLAVSTAYTRMFFMVDSADHLSAKTGLTVAVTLSKAGGAFGAAGGTVTEVSSGWYKIVLTTTDTNTAGDLAYHCTSAGADPTDFVDQVASAITPLASTVIADAIFNRATSNFQGTAPALSLGAAVIAATHMSSVDAGTGVLTIYQTDDTTPFKTRTVTADPSLDPAQAVTKLA